MFVVSSAQPMILRERARNSGRTIKTWYVILCRIHSRRFATAQFLTFGIHMSGSELSPLRLRTSNGSPIGSIHAAGMVREENMLLSSILHAGVRCFHSGDDASLTRKDALKTPLNAVVKEVSCLFWRGPRQQCCPPSRAPLPPCRLRPRL